MLQVSIGEDEYAAQVLEFTDDGSPFGDRLLPGFRHHSCWSGIGRSSDGNIYLAASNHYQTTTGSGNNGNVALYKWTPVPGEMTLLGDLKSVSQSVNNWMPYESQHKVHSFLMENADRKMYFTTLDYYPSYLVRGSHIYTIDLETDEIADYSKTQPYVMKKDFSVVENTDQPSTTSGVAVEYYGIKGISLNPNVPDIMYGMTFSRDASGNDPGYVLKYKLEGDFVDISVIPGFETARIHAYPNPFDEQITFDFSRVKMTEKPFFRIYDVYGRLLFQDRVSSDQMNWNGEDAKGCMAPQGLYIYSVKINSRMITGKIMKQ
jgi:hypothetical protein